MSFTWESMENSNAKKNINLKWPFFTLQTLPESTSFNAKAGE